MVTDVDSYPRSRRCYLYPGEEPEVELDHPLTFTDLSVFFFLYGVLLSLAGIAFIAEVLVFKKCAKGTSSPFFVGVRPAVKY